MDKYIIVNETSIQKRIEELNNKGSNSKLEESLDFKELGVLKQILSHSTPLIPILEQAFDAGQFEEYKNISFDGGENYETVRIIKEKEEYISNLKLDI